MGIIVRLNQQRTDCPPKSDFTTPKNHYIAFCQSNNSIPLYMQAWWLDTVCTEGAWDVCLAYDIADQIEGVLVYYFTQKNGLFSAIQMPALTPHTGLWMREMDEFMPRQHEIYEYKQRVLSKLIFQLPSTLLYHQNLHYSLTDCQPFYRNGFKAETHYSYILEDIHDLETVYDNMSDSTRRGIRKAEKDLIFGTCDDFEVFIQMVEKINLKQKVKPNLDLKVFEKLDKQLIAKELRKMYVAFDTEGMPHAAIYIIYDNTSAHYLFGVSDSEKQSNAATSLLLWQAIQNASNSGLDLFDFEGGMHSNEAFIFQNLNAIQKPFFKITKSRNRFYELFL
jgi:hypothetical protein